MYEYQCRILRVVDGDTLHVEVDLGLETSRKLKVRLAEINAPETSTEAGLLAKNYLTALVARFPPDYWWTIRTIKDRTEKYGRYLAHISSDPAGQSVNDIMVQTGHAEAVRK